MTITQCFAASRAMLMEGALGERLKREYDIAFDEQVAMAGLVYEETARKALRELWNGYAHIAQERALPFLATTPTRRANRERVANSNFSEEIIADNVRFLQEVRDELPGVMYLGGLMGCRGDAYSAAEVLDETEAAAFHSWQAEQFQRAGVDFLFAGIMPALPEALGMARAMAKTGLPYIISFMLRANGRLLDGTSIHDAILRIESGAPRAPLCYMTNCVHPANLHQALQQPMNRTPLVYRRFLGIQANTSALPPEALDGSEELKTSGPCELAGDVRELRRIMQLKIAGGCCGTDFDHMREIAAVL